MSPPTPGTNPGGLLHTSLTGCSGLYPKSLQLRAAPPAALQTRNSRVKSRPSGQTFTNTREPGGDRARYSNEKQALPGREEEGKRGRGEEGRAGPASRSSAAAEAAPLPSLPSSRWPALGTPPAPGDPCDVRSCSGWEPGTATLEGAGTGGQAGGERRMFRGRAGRRPGLIFLSPPPLRLVSSGYISLPVSSRK